MPEKPKTIQELFSERTHWTRGANARNANDKLVVADSPWAVCWCLMGAIDLVYPNQEENAAVGKKLAVVVLEKFRQRCHTTYLDDPQTVHVARFNDNVRTTIDDVQLVAKLADV